MSIYEIIMYIQHFNYLIQKSKNSKIFGFAVHIK